MMTFATPLPRWTRIAAPILGLWYAFGLAQMVMGYAADPGAVPGLIWAAYALACSAGLIGSAALGLAPRLAARWFAGSLAAAVTFFGYTFAFTAPGGEEIGIGVMVMAITLAALLVSRRFA